MLSSAYAGYKIAIIENEVGEVNLDAGELQGDSVSVREISSGCICCTVKGSFTEAVDLLVQHENPDYIVVEPSGVAALADVANACIQSEYVTLNRVIMVINAKKFLKLRRVVGDFFLEQIRSAEIIYLNFVQELTKEQLKETQNSIQNINPEVMIVSTPLEKVTEDTFPEGRAFNRNNITHSQIFLQTCRNTSKINGIPLIRSGKKSILTDWCYEFQGTFDEERIQKLTDIFRQEQCADIWRVKGYLRMQEGGIKKIDYVFGDQFLEERDFFERNKTNILVIIGKKINVLWLKKQFEKLK